MSTSIVGLNEGNSLTYTPLSVIPPNQPGLPVNYNQLTMGPRYSSFQPQFSSPAGRNYALASGTAHGWGLGAYNMSTGPFMSAFNDVAIPNAAYQCSNAQEAVLTGPLQCLDSSGHCVPPTSEGCAVGSVQINVSSTGSSGY